MKISIIKNNKLPKLLWVASCHGEDIKITHGSFVEKQEEFIISGAWAGDYVLGDLDKTDLIVGTGIRFRENKVIFVTPGNTLDRVVSCNSNGVFYVSNSLAALLAIANLDLIEGYNYVDDIETIIKGINKYTKSLPTTSDAVQLTYFRNLVYDNGKVYEVSKDNPAPEFDKYNNYYNYLLDATQKISSNASSKSRKYPISYISTLSSGYDSVVASVLAKNVGCKNYVTLEGANSYIRRKDSGKEAAHYLGVDCKCYSQKQDNYPNEIASWSVVGTGGDVSLSVFDYPEPVSLMFTGFHGDMIWDRKYHNVEEIERCDLSGLRFSEFRLHQGIILFPVPFIGIQNAKQIQQISFSKEMLPWTLFNDYDRPIARRIVESSGIPREIYATYKATSSFETLFPRPHPHSKALVNEFRKYAKSRGIKLPSILEIRLWELGNLIVWNINKFRIKLPIIDKLFLRWDPFPNKWLFFHWSNNYLKKQYSKIIDENA